jgi:hypothetical protein
MEQRNAIGPDHPLKRSANGSKKSRFFLMNIYRTGTGFVVEFPNQMREHFGVSLRAKFGVATADKILFERLIIFDHAVVHQREFTAGVEVRVRVFIGHFAVRGPAGVTDPKRTRKRSLRDQLGKCRNAAGTFAGLEVPSIHDCNASGIVAAIFKTP